MPGQRHVVDKDRMVADHAVVANVRVGHNQIVIADDGLAAILHRATMYGRTLAYGIAGANGQPRGLIAILQVGGRLTHRGKLIDMATGADGCGPLDDHVGLDNATFRDIYVRPDVGPGADSRTLGNFGAGINDRGRVNHAGRSAHRIVADAQRLSSTSACTAKLPDATLLSEYPRMQIHAIAGHAGAFEAQIVCANKHIYRAVCGRFIHGSKAEHTCRLRHRLQHQYAGEHRVAGKVPVKIWFVDTQILVGDHMLAGHKLDNPVDQQERVAVRKVLADIRDIHTTVGIQGRPSFAWFFFDVDRLFAWFFLYPGA
jgi:hypothetical protein